MSHVRNELQSFKSTVPEVYEQVFTLSNAAGTAGFDQPLIELIKVRASQINGCAFCVQFHTLKAEGLGVTADQLTLLPAWRDAPVFSSRERAALAWTEALTLLTQGVSDEVYAQARAEFSEKELAYLSSAIVGINAWNRLGVAYRWTPPARKKAG